MLSGEIFFFNFFFIGYADFKSVILALQYERGTFQGYFRYPMVKYREILAEMISLEPPSFLLKCS